MIVVIAAALLASTEPGLASHYDQGVAARRAGDSRKAVEQLKMAVEAEPANADAWAQYGFALRDIGKSGEARAAFREALRLAPTYQDARDGLASLDHGDERARTVINIDGSATAVKNGSDWRELRVAGTTALSDRTTVSGAVEASRRFGRHDIYGEARIDGRLSSSGSYYLLAGGTVDADYRPRWQLGGGASHRIVGGRSPSLLTVDGSVARYAAGTTWTISPGAQQYLDDGRIWLTGKWINIFADGRHRSGVFGRIDIQASDRFRFFGGAARAPDLSEGRVLTTTSLFAGASMTLNDRIDWRLSAARDKPSNGLNRITLSTGLSIRVP